MPTALPRRTLGVVLTLLLAALVVGGSAGSADAVAYRYWNYYHVDNSQYAFAKTGPSDFVPKDGTVEAYRYGTSTGTKNGITPRADLAEYPFRKICAGTKAGAGEKRVGVILDYGVPADAASGETPPAPRTACAAVPTKATGQQVVDAVADVRTSKGIICGLDGYPVKACAVTVKSPGKVTTGQQVSFRLPAQARSAFGEKTASDSQQGGGVPWPLVGVVAAVVVIGGGALTLSRRNRSA
jgi:hypothetical protein